jgi:phosphoribosylamine--glycine ligase
MKVAIVGSGAREHALGWKLKHESEDVRLDFLPGNGGTAELGSNLDVEANDVEAVRRYAAKARPDLIVVGPEGPLAAGLVDRLIEDGYLVFGPKQASARIETSKVFAKELMSRYKIPTAPFKVFTSAAKAHAFIDRAGHRMVVKADGLARGKGAIVTKSRAEAHEAADAMITGKAFGEAGSVVVIEERLVGEEASVLAVTDGQRLVMLPPSQDHKPVMDGDRGPNTGGMGAYCPAPVVSDDMLGRVEETVFKRLLKGLAKEGLDYRGVIYAGLMINDDGVFVIEFNARFGDPETQSILPAVDADVGELLAEAAAGSLKRSRTIRPARWAVCVVAASGGYPGAYTTGKEITGIGRASAREGVLVFHAGTKMLGDGKLVTSGGRVLGVTGAGDTLRAARRTAYEAGRMIRFAGMHLRTDIGLKGLRRLRTVGVTKS